MHALKGAVSKLRVEPPEIGRRLWRQAWLTRIPPTPKGASPRARNFYLGLPQRDHRLQSS